MKNRSNNIGTLHFIAALFVMYGHQCALLLQPCPTLFGSQIQAVGVKVIFVISGYLITKSLLSIQGSRIKTTGVYLLKRLSRIYPELIGCLLVSAFVIAPFVTGLSMEGYWNNLDVISKYIVKNILMFPMYGLPGVFVDNPYPVAVNGSLWTLPVELLMYMIILFSVIFFTKENYRKCLYTIVAVLFVVASFVRFWRFPVASKVIYGTDWVQALNVMPYFLLGGVVNFYNIKKYLNVQMAMLLMLLFSVIHYPSQILSEVVSMFCITYLVFALSFEQEQKICIKKFIKTEYSYGIYLYGFVVQQALIHCLNSLGIIFSSVNYYFVLSVIISYVLACLSYNIFYKPIQNILNKLLYR